MRIARVCVCCLAFVGMLPGQGRATEPKRSCPDAGIEAVHAVAADPHLDVELADGRRLKLVGMRPPLGTPDWPGLAEMARGALSGWIVDAPLLATIRPGPKDRWGRNPARLFVLDPAGGAAKPVAAGLIEAGWALADPHSADPACLKLLLAGEATARAAGLGLWSDSRYRPLDALAVADLKARAGTPLIVEGTVLEIRPWRSVVFVNFVRRREEGLSVMITRKGLAAFGKSGIAPDGLKGRRVRVRGVAVWRGGPRMTIDGPQFLEIVD